MVLELPRPQGSTLASLTPLVAKLLAYALSFTFLAIYWNNHHHLFQVVERVNGAVLWANLHLLFWLSLIPFVTGWAGDNGSVSLPVALYGTVLFLAGSAYYLLVRALLALHSRESRLSTAIGRDTKGKGSLVIYAIAIPASAVNPAIAWALYFAVALVWLVPDRRIENTLRP